jgi:hypothetical protein
MCAVPLVTPDSLPLLFLGPNLVESRLDVRGNRGPANLVIAQGSFEQEPVVLQFIGGHRGQGMYASALSGTRLEDGRGIV